jgi:hypothetical protein
MRKTSGIVILTTWEELWEVAMSQPWLLRYFNWVGSKIREERVAGLNDLIRVMTRRSMLVSEDLCAEILSGDRAKVFQAHRKFTEMIRAESEGRKKAGQ